MYNAKNYKEQGGDKWVIGGELEAKPDTVFTGMDATESKAGLVKAVANIAESVEATSPTTAEFNALLQAFKDSGIMTADS